MPPSLVVPSRIRVSVAGVIPELAHIVFTTLMVLPWSVVLAFGKPGLHGGRVNGYGVFDLKSTTFSVKRRLLLVETYAKTSKNKKLIRIRLMEKTDPGEIFSFFTACTYFR